MRAARRAPAPPRRRATAHGCGAARRADFLDAPFEPLELPALGARGDGEPGSAARPARRGSAAGADAADDGARARDLTLADDDGALGLGLGAHHGGRGAEGGAEADAFEFGRDDGAYEHFADAEVETLRDNSAAPRGGLDPDGAARAARAASPRRAPS